LWLKEEQAGPGGGKQQLRIAGSAETAAGHAVDGGDWEFESTAEAEAWPAIATEDGEAGWAAKIEIAKEEYAAVIAGPGSYGFGAETAREVGGGVQGLQVER
jgi:hypothetical protein